MYSSYCMLQPSFGSFLPMKAHYYLHLYFPYLPWQPSLHCVKCKLPFIRILKIQFNVLCFTGIPGLRPKSEYVSTTCDGGNVYSTKIPYLDARVTFIKWLVNFFLEKKYLTAAQTFKNGVEVLPRIIQVCCKCYLV